jgi:NAD(P)-dependent dehydrogenase (short-subunit alcohol dehydrogenase family)
MIDYAGARVLVTGAASGIGKALAEALSARGAQMVLADVDAEGLAPVAHALQAEAIVCDLSDIAEASRLVEAARSHGPLSLVCSNAGIGRNKRLLKETDADMARVMNVNFFAGLALARAYATTLNGGRGRIMFTASENSLSMPVAVRGFGLGAYAASKHALLAAAEWLRSETDMMDVHVLLPGPVYTPLVAKNLPDRSQAPPGLRLLDPEECAQIALRGIDLGLLYIPTHAHLAQDMKPRAEAINHAIAALNLAI